MSNNTLILDEIVVRATPPTPEERAEFLENEAKKEREFWTEREKEDRSDRNERNSYRNNSQNEVNENRISDIVSGANTATDSIKKDLLAINYQNSFKEIVDKAHGNLKVK
ncbi:hypothetical protein A1D29_01940 [Pasteurellaceae bacterium Orientalotternb1]|nr:hypothetical protein A1D29_01940 [Pasteurellaceae bacterium Orientalotternb1]